MPTDAALATITGVPLGQTTHLLVPPHVACDDDEFLGLRVNGVVVPPVTWLPLRNEHVLHSFLTFAHAQLRFMAAASDAAALDAAMAWMDELKTFLVAETARAEAAVMAAGAGTAEVAGVVGDLRTARQRIAALHAAITKSRKSVLQSILELRNTGAVASLNGRQLADFLQGATVGSTRVAKRAAKSDANLDYDALCRNALVSLRQRLNAKRDAPNCMAPRDALMHEARCMPTAVSFYSLESDADMLQAAVSLTDDLTPEEVEQSVTAQEVLKVLGLVGVPYTARRGDLPDPWSFTVTRVHLGALLSETDLRVVAAMNGQSLKFPGAGHGADAVVTGVVPLQSLNCTGFDMYMKACADVEDLHASVNMRGVLARVPFDALAQACAVHLHLVQGTPVRAPYTEATLRMANDLRRQLSCQLDRPGLVTYFDTIAKGLAGQDVRAVLTGANAISCSLKPLSVLLLSRSDEAQQARASLPHVLRAAFACWELDAYCAAKRTFKGVDARGDRIACVKALLGFDALAAAASNPVGAPGDPEIPYAKDDVAAAVAVRAACARVALGKHGGPSLQELGEMPANAANSSDDDDDDDRDSWDDTAPAGAGAKPTERDLHWLPEMTKYLAVARVARHFEPHMKTMPPIPPGMVPSPAPPYDATTPIPVPEWLDDLIGPDAAVRALACAVFALQCTAEDKRVDAVAGIGLGPALQDADACRAYLTDIWHCLNKEVYNAALATKRIAERDAAHARKATTLASLPSIDAFISELNAAVLNRSSPVYPLLRAALLSSEGHGVGCPPAARLEKLCVLYTGRALATIADVRATPVWGTGMFEPRDEAWDELRAFLNIVDPPGGLWASLRLARDRRRPHTYRAAPNRHGHSNERPSFYGYGYKTMEEFRRDAEPSVIAQYFATHTRCCGGGPSTR